jgi:hypothetical protein
MVTSYSLVWPVVSQVKVPVQIPVILVMPLVGGGTGGGGVTIAESSLELLLQPAIKIPVEATITAVSKGFKYLFIFIELLLLK